MLDELAWEWQDNVEGHAIHLTNDADASRTAIFVAMREHKLYIMEGTAAKNRPPPVLFQQSLGWVDKDGNPVRYTIIYSNRLHGMGVYPVPPTHWRRVVGELLVPRAAARRHRQVEALAGRVGR